MCFTIAEKELLHEMLVDVYATPISLGVAQSCDTDSKVSLKQEDDVLHILPILAMMSLDEVIEDADYCHRVDLSIPRC